MHISFKFHIFDYQIKNSTLIYEPAINKTEPGSDERRNRSRISFEKDPLSIPVVKNSVINQYPLFSPNSFIDLLCGQIEVSFELISDAFVGNRRRRRFHCSEIGLRRRRRRIGIEGLRRENRVKGINDSLKETHPSQKHTRFS